MENIAKLLARIGDGVVSVTFDESGITCLHANHNTTFVARNGLSYDYSAEIMLMGSELQEDGQSPKWF